MAIENCDCSTLVTGWDKCSENGTVISSIIFQKLVADDGTNAQMVDSTINASTLQPLVDQADRTKALIVLEVKNFTLPRKESRTVTDNANVEYTIDKQLPFYPTFEVYNMPYQLVNQIENGLCDGWGYYLLDASGKLVVSSIGEGFVFPRAIQDGTLKISTYDMNQSAKNTTMITFTEAPYEGIKTYGEVTIDALAVRTLKPVKEVDVTIGTTVAGSLSFVGKLTIGSQNDKIAYAKSGKDQYILKNVTDSDTEITILTRSYVEGTNTTTLTFADQTVADVLSLQISGGGYWSELKTVVVA